MNDQQLDRILTAASPVDDTTIAALDLSSAESELMEDIVMLDVEEVVALKPRRRMRQRVVLSITAVAAISLIVAGLVTNTGTKSEFTPAAVRVAEANPRILVGAPGWRVTRADEFEVTNGEMTFGNGKETVDLNWRPSSDYDAFYRDRGVKENDRKNVTVLGREATMFRYAGTTDYTTILPPEADTFVEIRGDLGGEAPYREILESLHRVDVDTWLGAMPSSVVKPADRAAAVDEMLHGIPLPPGFDADKLRSGDTVKDRYQLGAQVAGTVACRWLDIWIDDAGKRDEAVAAMKTSHRWRVLNEMNAEGDYPEVLWEIADAMDGTRVLPSGKGPVVLTRAYYASALGCDSL